jgi:hypothetical protein
MPEWSTYEDRPAKRRGVEEIVFGRDTNSDTSTEVMVKKRRVGYKP